MLARYGGGGHRRLEDCSDALGFHVSARAQADWSLENATRTVSGYKVTKTKTALNLKQETYNLSDLKHDPHCGFVELGGPGSVSVSS